MVEHQEIVVVEDEEIVVVENEEIVVVEDKEIVVVENEEIFGDEDEEISVPIFGPIFFRRKFFVRNFFVGTFFVRKVFRRKVFRPPAPSVRARPRPSAYPRSGLAGGVRGEREPPLVRSAEKVCLVFAIHAETK